MFSFVSLDCAGLCLLMCLLFSVHACFIFIFLGKNDTMGNVYVDHHLCGANIFDGTVIPASDSFMLS